MNKLPKYYYTLKDYGKYVRGELEFKNCFFSSEGAFRLRQLVPTFFSLAIANEGLKIVTSSLRESGIL
jgi:hypothetical protein